MKTALVLLIALWAALPAAADVVVPIESVEHFVNIRAEADAGSDVIGRLYRGDTLPLVRSVPDWHEIRIDEGLNGFISADWTKVLTDSEAAPPEAADVPEAEAVEGEAPSTEALAAAPAEAPQPDVEPAPPAPDATLQADTGVPAPSGERGPRGEAGPPGPPGPPGNATLEGSVNFLTKFVEPNVGGTSQVYDDGRSIGIGTTEPKQRLEVNGNIQIHERNSTVAGLMITQSSGETGYLMHNRGSTLTIGAGSVDRITIDSAGNVGIGVTRPTHPLEMASGAHVTSGGVWTNGSSREDKENIAPLALDAAMSALAALEPVRFNYKADTEEDYLGFVAEDVPELVASRDRDGLSPMDIVAVLTRVVQEQQRRIETLEARMIE